MSASFSKDVISMGTVLLAIELMISDVSPPKALAIEFFILSNAEINLSAADISIEPIVFLIISGTADIIADTIAGI